LEIEGKGTVLLHCHTPNSLSFSAGCSVCFGSTGVSSESAGVSSVSAVVSSLCKCVLFHEKVVRLHDVLFVPKLGHSLVSWNVLKKKFFMSAHESEIFVTTVSNTPIFMARFKGSMPYILLHSQVHSSYVTNTESVKASESA